MSAGYGKSAVLHDVEFTVAAGECLGLVGSSGAGKSTAVLALMGLLPWRGGWAKGEVLLNGRNLLQMKESGARRVRGKEIALVPQSPASALNPALSLRSHFREAWRAHESDSALLAVRVRELLAQLQLSNDETFLARKPGQISVGQAQRVAIALALLHRPAVVIADEPTSALDPVNQVEISALLRRIQREHGMALLYISHDLVSVLQLCDRIAVLHGGSTSVCLSVDALDECHLPAELVRLLSGLPVPIDVMLRHCRHATHESHHSKVTGNATSVVANYDLGPIATR